MKQLQILTVALLISANTALAQDSIATLRGSTSLDEQSAPAMMAPVENKDIKRKRAYPMQPPTIPHKIDNYAVDLRSNKCLTCHSRKLAEASQAPAVSVTHYMDRDGNFLATVSPRRYFCEQCHVVQVEANPLVENHFRDIDEILHSSESGE